MTKKKCIAGFSMIEQLLVMFVVILILGSGIVLYHKAQKLQRQAETTELLTLIKDRAHNLSHGHGTYGPPNTDLVPRIIATGGIPEKFIDRATNLFSSPYGTPVIVVAGRINNQMEIRFPNLSRSECIVVAIAGTNGADNDLVDISVNAVSPTPVNTPSVNFVNTTCMAGRANVVSWNFR